MAQTKARDISTDALYVLGLASGQGDRDPREEFLPLVREEKEGATGRTTAQMSAQPDRLSKRASDSHRVEVGGQDGLRHRLNCVSTKDVLKF